VNTTRLSTARTAASAGLLVLLAAIVGACSSSTSATPAASVPPSASVVPARPNLILATTTSTQDSGLLDVLVPDFQARTGYVVKTVAVGSGQALKMGQDGNADVLLVHSPAAEVTFMDGGYGVDRRLVMHNDFVIVGPSADPAAIRGTATAADALKKIATAGATFISRGDKSGTNTAELALWKKAAITPSGAWYVESGQGMGATLQVASQKAGYTLTDRATYLAQKATLSLDILVEGDAALLNVYHVIPVNPAKWPSVNTAGAQAFADYLVSAEGQALIGTFGVSKFGQQLFVPDAGKSEDQLAPKP
jgi:tungstate transport system substrate-binding protein